MAEFASVGQGTTHNTALTLAGRVSQKWIRRCFYVMKSIKEVMSRSRRAHIASASRSVTKPRRRRECQTLSAMREFVSAAFRDRWVRYECN